MVDYMNAPMSSETAEVRETAPEARENRSESIEVMIALNEAKLSELPQIEANRVSGEAREAVVGGELEREYAGSNIQSECYLRDDEGKVVRDPQTGEARRIDFAVIKDSEVVKSFEVTSKTADKAGQEAKESRIREAGGNFIKDRSTDECVPFASGVKTEIVRIA